MRNIIEQGLFISYLKLKVIVFQFTLNPIHSPYRLQKCLHSLQMIFRATSIRRRSTLRPKMRLPKVFTRKRKSKNQSITRPTKPRRLCSLATSATNDSAKDQPRWVTGSCTACRLLFSNAKKCTSNSTSSSRVSCYRPNRNEAVQKVCRNVKQPFSQLWMARLAM